MMSGIFKFLSNLIGARYYHLLNDIDRLISSLKATSAILKDPFCNRTMIWGEIENDVERVKVYGKPVAEWIEKWVSYEFDDEEVLLHTIELGLVPESKKLGIDDEELGIDDEDSGVYDEKEENEQQDFLIHKINELYKIRNKVVRRIGCRMIIIALCIVLLVYVASPFLISQL